MNEETNKEQEVKTEINATVKEKEDCFRDKLNKHGQIEDESAPEDEI